MAITVRDLRIREKEHLERQYEARHPDIPGVIKSVDGYTRPPGQQSMTWVSILNQPESRVLVHNATIVDVAETPVWIGPETKPPYRLEVKGLYFGGLSQEQDHGASNLNVAKHGRAHQWLIESNPGPDAFYIGLPALYPLKTVGNGTNLIITTYPLKYFYKGRPVYFAGANTDLTTYLPATSGNTLRILIYLDEDTNTMSVSSSAEVVSGGAIDPAYPSLPDNARPSGYIQLTYGQSSIITATHIEGWRDLFNNDDPYTATFDRELKNWTMTVAEDTTATGAVELDYQDGNFHKLTLTGNVVISVVNPPATNSYGEITVEIRQDSTGGRTVTWPEEFYWPSAVAPTMTSAAGSIDLYKFYTTDGGATYIAWAVDQDFMKLAKVEVDTLTLSGSAETATISPVTSLTMDVLTLSGSAETATVVPGAVTITMDSLTLSGSAETCSVT